MSDMSQWHGCTSPCLVCDIGCVICNPCCHYGRKPFPLLGGQRVLDRWKSPRGNELYSDGLWTEVPKLTVEKCSKWYELWLVEKLVEKDEIGEILSWKVSPVTFDELDTVWPKTLRNPWIDHVPMPRAVSKLAQMRGWSVDLVALGAMHCRWIDEGFDGEGVTT